VNVPASPRRRKARLVRDEPPPDDALVVLRAAAPDRPRTLRNAALDATESGATYVVDRGDGRREVLYGISVFACRAGREPPEVLSAFALSPHYLELTVGQIREAGFDLIATGTNPDHYDVQLVAGRFEARSPDCCGLRVT
jgi:hypothetical protein